LALGVGMVFVSIEHRLARAEQKRAEEERARAEVAEKLASDFVSKFLVISTNNKLGDVAGSEGPRLELLNDAVAQLTAWAQAEPDSRQRSYDLAAALRERSLLFATTGRLDDAWADIDRAVECIDRIGPQSRHPGLLPVRLIAMSQMADLIAQRDGAAAAVQFLQPYQHTAEKLFQQNPSDAKARIALAALSLSYARSLANLDRISEAAELVDSAVTHCETLHNIARDRSVSGAIFDAPETLAYYCCIARVLQAQVAAMLGDAVFARASIERARRLCDEALEGAPDAVESWRIKLELLILECELGRAGGPNGLALQILRKADRYATEIAERFPTYREIVRLSGRIAVLHGEHELDGGTLARAALAAGRALRLLRWPDESRMADHRALRTHEDDVRNVQAERLSAEIAWLEGNACAAWIHCQAARDALWNCGPDAFAAGELGSELALVELIEAQTWAASPSTAGPSKLLE
jgi:tetratricopeptide (TPR) repeat protein